MGDEDDEDVMADDDGELTLQLLLPLPLSIHLVRLPSNLKIVHPESPVFSRSALHSFGVKICGSLVGWREKRGSRGWRREEGEGDDERDLLPSSNPSFNPL